jgi:hypothetical protein
MVLVAAALAVPTAVCSHFRDLEYVDACNSTDDWRYAITGSHAIAKGVVLFSTLVMSLYGANILYSAVRKWKEGVKRIEAQKWDGENCSDFVFTKFTKLYNDYIEVGTSTCLEYEALRYWFALAYIIYLTFISIQAAHILLLMGSKREVFILDLAHSFLNILTYALGFFSPYLLANYSRTQHNRYRKEMYNAFLEIKIDVKVGDGVMLHSCQPGNGVFKATNYRTVNSNGEYSPASSAPNDNQKERFQEAAKEIYREYFQEACRVQGTNVLMGKKEEFDFIPSLIIINIPLDSSGYTMAIFLSILSVVCTFIP